MKKKVVSALLCATMVATMFAGCGSKESSGYFKGRYQF